MIYYSHVNEDNRVERQLLQSSGCSSVVAIAGSGERIISLLDYEGAEDFYAVDVNNEALYLLELKLAILKNYSVDGYLGFCGYKTAAGSERINCFEKIKHLLAAETRVFWNNNTDALKKGIAYTGHFEKFLERIRPFIRFYLGKDFFAVFSSADIRDKKFPVKRWQLLMKLYKKRWVYRIWGNKDIAFVSPDADTAHIPAALNRIISANEAASCFMAHLIFKGHLKDMDEKDLPPSLQQSVLQQVKKRLMDGAINIHYRHKDILAFAGKFSGYNVFYSISDILSFADNTYLEQLLDKTTKAGNQIVWRSFLRNRSNTGDAFKGSLAEVKEYSSEESTRMYQVFSIQTASVK